ncbi:hypothetical protein [Methanococcoides burtonii]|uniref:Uncharacterized protein n=1 Tax=Methanococcoides burtonii (strain DSM 6242 / NBRC 107633 / OCM 468 / ACE-M) TaxID=259564 RepID=Q12VN0_METBU|nr:hypothetical protein [Methanococcoides burtonii]ABE52496.1 Hypothetical protein Mbur_1592 [Methanococcoides burtonii DSM 6242]
MSEIKKLIYLLETPMNERDYKRFGIEILQQNGYEIQFWDVTPIVCPEDYETKLNEPICLEDCILFTSLDDLKVTVSNLDSNYYIICLIAYRLKSFSVYNVLSKTKLAYCVAMNNALPSAEHKRPSLLYRIKNSNFHQKIDFAFNRIPFKWFGIKPANLVLAGGAVSLTNNTYPIDETTEILWLHALDYDLYLDELSNPVEDTSEPGVFLDSYLPFHPDFIRTGSPSPATADEYYPLLHDFFNRIESTLDTHMVIAAHPRSRYEDHPNYFGEMPLIRGKTVELVRRSKFVITHNSTAINLAVLFRKPIIFVTTDELDRGWMGLDIESLASRFGKSPLNLNEPLSINWEKELSVNENAYLKYENDYIKRSNTQISKFWQIFADHIREYNDTNKS